MNQSPRLTTLDLPSIMANLHRSSIGFDRMFDDLTQNTKLSNSNGYPPHDIVKHSDLCYSIEIATAGFKEEELEILLENNVLTIKGNKIDRETREYLHQGISARAFTKVLNLAEHVVVTSAKYEDGMLIINVEIVVPEELKPRKIEIQTVKQLKK